MNEIIQYLKFLAPHFLLVEWLLENGEYFEDATSTTKSFLNRTP